MPGRMLGALTAVGPLIGRQTPMIDELIAALPYHQHPDGHFGVRQNLSLGIKKKQDMSLLWGNGDLLIGLNRYLRKHPSQGLLEMAKRLGDYIISTRAYYGKKENFTNVGGIGASGFTTCYPFLNAGLAGLGNVTSEKRFYDEARFIARLSLLDRELIGRHSSGRLSAYFGMLNLDRFTGTREFVDTVAACCQRITKEFPLPTSGVAEYFDNKYPRDECCPNADWIRVNFLLWQATGDTHYLDKVECILRNHLLAAQFSNGGFGHYVLYTLRDGDKSYPYAGFSNAGFEAYWCCAQSGPLILADLARWGVLGSDDTIMITWLSEVCSKLEVGNKSITVTIEEADPALWKLWLKSPEQTNVTVRLRIPEWAKTITVNSQNHYGKEGWVDIPCKWSGVRTLEVGFPDNIRLAGAYEQQFTKDKAGRVFAGPDLFCLPDVSVDKDFLTGETIPTIVLSAGKPSGGTIPVVVQSVNSKTQKAKLVPVSQRPPGGCRMLFKVRRVDAETFKKYASSAKLARQPGVPVELMFACDGQYTLYFNGEKVINYQGWHGSPRVVVYSDQPSNVIAVKALSQAEKPGLIGLVRIGERVYDTSSAGWTVVPCKEQPPEEWLTDTVKGTEYAEKLQDLGGFGAPPWDHIPAQFAGTAARWFWPEDNNPKDSPQWWLFRYTISIASP